MRTLLISALIFLIVLLGGVWAYLLLNGAPEGIADIRQNIFGGEGSAVVTAPSDILQIPTEAATDRIVPLGAPLVAVTDRATAGAVIAATGSSTILRYVEKGTGHIFEISLETGLEVRVSNTTIPGAVRALWAPSGEEVVIETDTQGSRGATYLGTMSTSTSGTTFDLQGIAETLDNIAFSTTNTLFYTTRSDGGTIAWTRELPSDTVTEVFRLPFSESIVLWDVWEEKNHYAYTKPASGFRGFLYAVGAVGLRKVDEGTTLYAARLDANLLFIGKNRADGGPSLLLDTASGLGSLTSIPGSREKCTAGRDVVWCAASGEAGEDFPISWYQGTVSYNDDIYRIEKGSGAATLELDLETLAREPIDVTDMSAGPDGRVIFRNKVDDSLWLLNPSPGL